MLSKRKALLGLALTVILLVLIQSVVLANPEENPDITIKVKGLYGEYVRQPGTWLPIQVEIKNQGPDIKGVLRILPNTNGPAAAVDYLTRVVIPTGTTKQFKLTVPVYEYLSSLKVELATDKGVVAKGKGEFTFMGPEQIVAGLVDRSGQDFGALGSLKLNGGFSPILVKLQGKNLPDKAGILSMFNLLVMDDINLRLNEEQANALNLWVNEGGVLVVGGGSGWQKVLPNLPEELKPVEVTGMEERTIGLSGEFKALDRGPGGPVKMLTLKTNGGKELFVQDGRPLAVEYALGQGRIVFLAFDPALEPMASWSGSKLIWNRVVSGISTNSNTVNQKAMFVGKGENFAWNLAGALNNIPAMQLPSVKIMFIILLIYLLLAGIINYLVLKKLDKREWAWLTLPVLAVAFVLLAYLTSFQTKPSDLISNQISVVEANPQSSLAKLTTATGVFAPTRNSYRLEFNGEYLVSAAPGYDGPMVQGPDGKFETQVAVEQSEDKTIVELQKLRSWSMRSFITVGETRLAGNVAAKLSVKDNKVIATVVNNTGYDFTDGVILSNPFWYVKVGALKSGAKLEAEVPVESQSSLGTPLMYQIYNTNGVQPERKDMLRQQVMSWLLNEASGVDSSGIYFLGWSETQVKGAVSLPDKTSESYYTTLFRVPLVLTADKGNLQVPPGIITGTMLEGKNVGTGPPGIVMMQPDAELVYGFQLPEGKFDELRLNIGLNGGSKMGPGPAPGGVGPTPQGYLFNWKRQVWEEKKLDNALVEDYAKYLNKNRELRLKLKTRQDEFFEVSAVSISLNSKGGGSK